MIKLKNIGKTYRLGGVGVNALKNVSLNISQGEFVAIMGPSGSGKSTLLHILGLLDKPESGSYELMGREVAALSADELAILRNETFGFIFQMFNLLPRVSAVDNVAVPLLYASGEHNENFSSPVSLLKRVGMEKRSGHFPNELSGGEQQRVAVARALVKNPRIVLADEPTGNLDSVAAGEIMKLLKELNDSGIAIIMVTHEEELGMQARRVLRVFDGEIISDETLRGAGAASGNSPAAPPLRRHRLINFTRARNYFKQALRALLASKTRSFLSILGVLIGVASVIAMLALGAGARADVQARISSMGANLLTVRPARRRTGGVSYAAGSRTRLTAGDARDIEKISQAENVSAVVSGRGQAVYGNKNWSTSVSGVAPQYQDMRQSHAATGRYFTRAEMLSRSRLAILGKTVARELFGDENPLGKNIKIDRINFSVIGTLAEKGATGWRDNDDEIIIPLNTAMYRLLGKKFVDYIDVEVKDEKDIPLVQEEIKSIIARRHNIPAGKEDAVEVRNMAEIQEAISATAKTFSWLLGSIAFISMLVGGIGIMNIMLVSVTERTREIGLRKAVGANDRDILLQFVIEAVAVCLIGGSMGILTGSLISAALAKFAGWSMKISPQSVLLAFFFSAGIGLFFGLWPAKKASRLNPIDALRYE